MQSSGYERIKCHQAHDICLTFVTFGTGPRRVDSAARKNAQRPQCVEDNPSESPGNRFAVRLP